MKDIIYILYIHGMGGGGDSRIPSILKEHINSHPDAPAAHLGRSLDDGSIVADAVQRRFLRRLEILRQFVYKPEFAQFGYFGTTFRLLHDSDIFREDTNKRRQKQVYLYFAEREYIRRSQR